MSVSVCVYVCVCVCVCVPIDPRHVLSSQFDEQECPVGGGLGCEAIKIGENVSVTNGTEVSVEDLLRYVTSDSLASCETNRSESCDFLHISQAAHICAHLTARHFCPLGTPPAPALSLQE